MSRNYSMELDVAIKKINGRCSALAVQDNGWRQRSPACSWGRDAASRLRQVDAGGLGEWEEPRWRYFFYLNLCFSAIYC